MACNFRHNKRRFFEIKPPYIVRDESVCDICGFLSQPQLNGKGLSAEINIRIKTLEHLGVFLSGLTHMI